MYRIPIYECQLVQCGEQVHSVDRVDCFEQATRIIHGMTKHSPCERIIVVYLNGANGLMGAEQVSQGGLHGCAIMPRDVVRGALVANASAIVIGHNHPSGDPTPSVEDIRMTEELAKVCDMIGVPLLDHVIVTRDGKSRSILS